MLYCIIDCLEKGVFIITPQKGLETDFEGYAKMQEKYLDLKISRYYEARK